MAEKADLACGSCLLFLSMKFYWHTTCPVFVLILRWLSVTMGQFSAMVVTGIIKPMKPITFLSIKDVG